MGGGVRLVDGFDGVQVSDQVLAAAQREAGHVLSGDAVTTADHDDRVVPSHTFKFTAAMQAAQGCAKPVLVRVETQGSHGYLSDRQTHRGAGGQWAFAAAKWG